MWERRQGGCRGGGKGGVERRERRMRAGGCGESYVGEDRECGVGEGVYGRRNNQG